jgi:glucose/arabinose dehydrogenase
MRRFNPIPVLCILLISFTACAPTASPTDSAPTTSPVTPANPTATAGQAANPTVAPRNTATTAATNAPLPTQASPTDPPAPASPTTVTVETDTPGTAADTPFTLDIEPIADGFQRPVFVTGAGDGSNRLFVVEQPGRIYILKDGKKLPTVFLDISNKIATAGNEQGLLGLAFSPDFKNNGIFFVNYSKKGNGDNVIERYQVSSDPNVADPSSAKMILTIPGFEPNHNSGMLVFGPDGYLYIGAGDGGGGGDQHGTIGNGQALDALNGKILRIDVSADTYKIPATNPFVNNSNARPEIWDYGFRNPWRFSFDRATGDLYVGDVGQNNWEEIDFEPAGSKGGLNYGWRIMEGLHCYNPATNCDMTGLVLPIFNYNHDAGCSVTGGYVYRGTQYPWLVGQYIFADYCTGVARASMRDASGKWVTRQVTKFDDTISSFGQDDAGEIYVLGHGNGTIYKLTTTQ